MTDHCMMLLFYFLLLTVRLQGLLLSIFVHNYCLNHGFGSINIEILSFIPIIFDIAANTTDPCSRQRIYSSILQCVFIISLAGQVR